MLRWVGRGAQCRPALPCPVYLGACLASLSENLCNPCCPRRAKQPPAPPNHCSLHPPPPQVPHPSPFSAQEWQPAPHPHHGMFRALLDMLGRHQWSQEEQATLLKFRARYGEGTTEGFVREGQVSDAVDPGFVGEVTKVSSAAACVRTSENGAADACRARCWCHD